MRELFAQYANRGAMTIDELCLILNRSKDWVRRNSKGDDCLIPRLPGLPIRFDPSRMVEVFCGPPKVEKPRSLTIERHKTGARSEGGYRKCL